MNNYEQNENNEIKDSGVSLAELLYLIKKNLVLIIVITMFFTLCGCAYGVFVKKPTYQASATVVVQTYDENIQPYNSFLLASYLVNSFTGFISSEAVTTEVAKELINNEYEIEFDETIVDNELIETIYSKKQDKTLSHEEYDRIVNNKAIQVQNGISISTTSESLIFSIKYSEVEKNEYTSEEVVKIVRLLIEKAQTVSLKRVPADEFSFPLIEAENSAREGLIKFYGLTAQYENGQISEYLAADGNRWTIEKFENDVVTYKEFIRNNIVVYKDDISLVIGMRQDSASIVTLEEGVLGQSIIYLTQWANNNPSAGNATRYLYPDFANKLVAMNLPTRASSHKGTVMIVIIAFLIGIVISFGIVLIRFLSDDTFTSKEEIEHLTGANVLTFISKFDKKEEK